MARLEQELVARLERLAASEGLELLAIEVAGTARKPVVRLIIDRDGESGVSLSDCESVSRQASVLLDAHDPFPNAYSLEVSSPGIERKFYSDHDYARFTGRVVKVRMKPSWRGTRSFEGTLEGMEGGVIRLRDLQGVVQELPEAEVFETRLAPFLEEKLKNQEARRGKR